MEVNIILLQLLILKDITQKNNPVHHCQFILDSSRYSLQHVNRSLSSVGGTVAAACAAWDQYCLRHEHLQNMNGSLQQKEQPQFLNADTAHLCWGGKIYGFIVQNAFWLLLCATSN